MPEQRPPTFPSFTIALRKAIKQLSKAGINQQTKIEFLRVIHMKKDDSIMNWNHSIEYVGFQFRFNNIFYQFRYDYDKEGPHINFTINNQAYAYYWPDQSSKFTELPAQCKKLAFYDDKKDDKGDRDHWKGKIMTLDFVLNLDPNIRNQNYQGNWSYQGQN